MFSNATQLLRNVTSGSFLEADQLRQINFSLHLCDSGLMKNVEIRAEIPDFGTV